MPLSLMLYFHMHSIRSLPPRPSGFTLIELSIVLVIISLIIGGILIGSTVIKAAEIRSVASQVEKYNSAVYTFLSKYNELPGDILSSSASAFGLQTRSGAAGHGDGNRKVMSCSGSTNWNQISCETGLFWRDLADASLIAGGFNKATDTTAMSLSAAQLQSYLPTTALGKSNFLRVVYEDGGLRDHIYYLHAIASINAAGFITFQTSAYGRDERLTPWEAFGIDQKLDDGMPCEGKIRYSRTTGSYSLWPTGSSGNFPAPGACAVVVSGRSFYYTSNATHADIDACALLIKTGW